MLGSKISANQRRTRRPSRTAGWLIAWLAVWTLSLLGLFALAVGTSRALHYSDDDATNRSAAMFTLLDTGSDLQDDINRIIQPAIGRTNSLARSPQIIQALASGNKKAQTDLLNSEITSASEFDAIALFNSTGRITAINTIYNNGQTIAKDRVGRVLGTDFSHARIIQSCVRNNSTAPMLEFQTHCDITPAFFDSSGLAVAYSVPVINPEDGARLGVISCRLRFERLTTFTEERILAGGAAKAYFISDAGNYFAEAINSGREKPPVPLAELKEIAGSILGDAALKTVTDRAGEYLAIFSLQGVQTLSGGGIHILIVADRHWLMRGPRQDRLLRSAGAGLIGTLLLIVAGLVHKSVAARRNKRTIEEANELNARLAAIVESSSEGIVSESLDSTIRSWNRGAEKMFGYSAEEAIGRPADLIEPADRRGEIPRLRKAVLDGVTIEQFETRRMCKDGRQIDISLSISLIRNVRGEVMGFSRIARDITSKKKIEMELRQTHDDLKTAHTALVDAARRAGMAEVAIGVLHNVGNVLNSVNVSVCVVDEKVRRSKATSLGKVVAMLKEHEADLGQFMERDGKGAEVLAYLEKLSQAIAAEQQEVLSEMEGLSKNVEHVKEIVNAQQSYATAVVVAEPLNVRDLLEDALRINLISLGRHQVSVVREYSDTQFVVGDKHKVLQVLVNLITNAKQAMSASEIKRLTLSTETGPDGEVRVSIRDTGCGIAAENVTRIFAHGFTTKAGGHGFGLHSAVLAAKEMNGALTVSSDGLGLGAMFVLELPSVVRQPVAA
jgi:PAS domain S-box-containing protein